MDQEIDLCFSINAAQLSVIIMARRAHRLHGRCVVTPTVHWPVLYMYVYSASVRLYTACSTCSTECQQL